MLKIPHNLIHFTHLIFFNYKKLLNSTKNTYICIKNKTMNITKAFSTAFIKMKERKWDKIYIAVDIHDTIFRGCYDKTETFEWLGESKAALQLMSSRDDIVLILWSSAHIKDLEKYITIFEENDIHFPYVNCNPEVEDTNLASFKDKFYMNIGIDDKFGFEAETDWSTILSFFKKM